VQLIELSQNVRGVSLKVVALENETGVVLVDLLAPSQLCCQSEASKLPAKSMY
jgi:hypothetical protein